MSGPAPGAAGSEPRTFRQWLGIYLRGAVMGMAELVPGVSGGTIAFVTGIYDELIHTLANLKPGALGQLREDFPSAAAALWRAHNLSFLLVLGFGMITSVVLLAHALSLALIGYRPVVWGFFLGLIALSVWLLGRQLPVSILALMAPVGMAAGVGLSVLEPFAGEQSLVVFFLVGALAVSAWLLPAISGSFVLLTLGLYEAVLGALTGPEWGVLGVFLSGCAVGLLVFSRLLSAALRRWRSPLLAFLTGFMAGASFKLWPWQVAGKVLGPLEYAATGEPAFLPAVAVSVLAGGLTIWLLSLLEP